MSPVPISGHRVEKSSLKHVEGNWGGVAPKGKWCSSPKRRNYELIWVLENSHVAVLRDGLTLT